MRAGKSGPCQPTQSGLVLPLSQQPEVSERTTAGGKPQLKRQGRTRKRGIGQENIELGSNQDLGALGKGQICRPELIFEEDQLEVGEAATEAEESERPRKRRVGFQDGAKEVEADGIGQQQVSLGCSTWHGPRHK